jgi:hypothetical protein
LATSFDEVLELRVELRGIKPPIWRRIQVPGASTFWDLHSAIQDAMGWLDGHLHAFVARDRSTGLEAWIGVPDPESLEPARAGWEVKVRTYLTEPGTSVEYLYDFGDGWEHKVTLQKIRRRDPTATYPRCIAGKRACPPEDCGGIWGYRDIVSGDADAREAYPDYDPEAFDLSDVIFEDPTERRKYLEMWTDF